jgi:CelD/BcsL family acetyltransferase involved in cellulose biosynthesis
LLGASRARGSLVPSYVLEAINDRAELLDRAPAWRDLCEAERSSCFARPEWVLPYTEVFEPSALVVFAYDGKRLAGVFACREGNHRIARTLCTLGGDHVPELELALSGDRERLLASFVEWAFEQGYAELHLPRASRDAPTYRELDRTFVRSSHMVYERVDRHQHHTRVDSDFATFVRGQSKNFRKTVSKAQRAARELRLAVDVHTNRAEVERVLPALVDVSAASWQGRAGTGTFCNTAYRRCYTEATLGLADAARVRLMVCRRGDAPIGFILHFVERDRLVALKSEFAEAESACMAGWQIASVAVDEAHGLGLGEVTSGCFVTDFKQRWTTHRSPCADLIVFAPSTTGRLSFAFPHLAKELVKRVWGRRSVARCLPLLDWNAPSPTSEAQQDDKEDRT